MRTSFRRCATKALFFAFAVFIAVQVRRMPLSGVISSRLRGRRDTGQPYRRHAHTHRESAPAKVLAEGASQVAPSHVVDSHLRDKVHPERALVSARLQLHIHHLLTDFYHLGSNACVFTGARECRIGVHTAFIDINAPRCAALLARAGGDLGRLSGDFKIVTGVCVGQVVRPTCHGGVHASLARPNTLRGPRTALCRALLSVLCVSLLLCAERGPEGPTTAHARLGNAKKCSQAPSRPPRTPA